MDANELFGVVSTCFQQCRSKHGSPAPPCAGYFTQTRLQRASLVVVLLLVASGVGTIQAGASPVGGDHAVVKNLDATEQSLPPVADVDELDGEEEEGEDAEDSDEDETGASLIGDWWGLGGEVSEAPYIGVVEAGVVFLVLGVPGYSIVKRKRLLPVQYRRYQLPELRNFQPAVKLRTTQNVHEFS